MKEGNMLHDVNQGLNIIGYHGIDEYAMQTFVS